jgi:hypothetical protein
MSPRNAYEEIALKFVILDPAKLAGSPVASSVKSAIGKRNCNSCHVAHFDCEDLRKSGFGGEHTDSNHLLM